MRLKQYYTLDEITVNLFTSGSEWMLEDGTEYIGSYHKYITNEIYTETAWNPNKSVKLIKYKPSDKLVDTYKKIKSVTTKYQHVNPYVVVLSAEAINTGIFTRYFIQKQNDFDIIEIDQKQYQKWQNGQIDPNLYKAISIIWTIKGNATDIKQHGVTVLSVSNKNKKQVRLAEKQMPGISKKLTNYSEFYLNSDIVTPKDINA
jgi:hypothetical protein